MTRPVKDVTSERKIPDVWKPAFHEIVNAFRAGDFELSEGIPEVKPTHHKVATQIKEYVEDYGETLDALPSNAWDTSVTRWMEDYWDVLVDLWTIESGSSDLVMSLRVFEDGDGYRIEVLGVYVP